MKSCKQNDTGRLQFKWMSPTVVWRIIWKRRKKRGVEVKKNPKPENHLEFWFSIPNKKDTVG